MKPLEEIIRENSRSLAPLPTGVDARLDRFENVKAVLFDVYGTLFVSGSGDVGTAAATDSAEALEQALDAAGYEGSLAAAGAMGKEMLTAAIHDSHRSARENGVDYPEVEITEIWKQVIDRLHHGHALISETKNPDQIRQLALEYECRVNPVYPMPGAGECIASIRNRGLIAGIVSNAQFYTPLMFPAFFDSSLEELGFDPECCVWSYKEGRAKPSRDLFPKVGRALKQKHGIALHETVYIGNDMLNDISCADASGCRTVLFAGDRRSLRMRENDERCLAVRPEAVIISLSQLLEIV